MKTIIIKFPVSRATEVGILLYALEMKTLNTWCNEDFMGDINISSVLKLGGSNAQFSEELQMEKLKEKSFIKILK